MSFKEDGRHVKSITALAKWLNILVDNTDNIILGLFSGESPKDGIAYESGEGQKFTKKIAEINKSKDIWYITLHIFHYSRPDNLAAEVTKKILAELGTSKVDLEISLIRLLPFKPKVDSIEFLSPPFQIAKKEGEIEVESFEMLTSLYQRYLALKNNI